MLQIWPNSIQANYTLFFKNISLHFHWVMKKIVFQPPCLSQSSIVKSPAWIHLKWPKDKFPKCGRIAKNTAIPQISIQRKIQDDRAAGASPSLLKEILLHPGVGMTYLRIHTKYHPRESGIPWKHIVCFLFKNEKRCKVIQKVKFLHFLTSFLMLHVAYSQRVQHAKDFDEMNTSYHDVFLTTTFMASQFCFSCIKQREVCLCYSSLLSEVSIMPVYARFSLC